jgi:hypothetical protein
MVILFWANHQSDFKANYELSILEIFLETMCHNELCYTLEMFLEPCVIMNCVTL